MNILDVDLLEHEPQTCMICGKVCTSAEGTWPQYEGTEPMMDADLNNRSKEEFVCYDCNP